MADKGPVEETKGVAHEEGETETALADGFLRHELVDTRHDLLCDAGFVALGQLVVESVFGYAVEADGKGAAAFV